MEGLLIKKSSKEGSGVFTDKNFSKGEFIFEFSGEIVGWPKANFTSLQIGRNKFINPYKDNPGVYLNHSCDPNCGIKQLNKVIAMRDIGKGEEITIDYSTTIYHKYKIECCCGSSKCRKFIKPFESLPDVVKKRYKDWASEFVK